VKTLVISCHPDDEVLGMGGTIQKLSREGEVYLCILTVGSEEDYTKEELDNKRREVLKSSEFLGIRKVFFGEFRTLHLDTIPQLVINRKIEAIIDEVQPQQVFTHYYNDVNLDHQVAFNCTLTATRPSKAPSVKKLICYEVMSCTEWGNPLHGFTPNMFVDISDYLANKIKALEMYKSEARDDPHPRSLSKVNSFAISRGAIINVEAAETFYIMREIY